jgi:hypothetical protein
VKADPVIVSQDDSQDCSSIVQSGTFNGAGVLVRDCAVWFALGFNDYRLMNYAAGLSRPFLNTTTANEGCGPILSAEDQAYELARIKDTGANVVRVWFFQKYFQDFMNADLPYGSNKDPWEPYVHLLQAAKDEGLLVIPVLVNDWNQCDRLPSSGVSSPANDGQHADYTFFGPGPGGATPGYQVPGTFGYTYSARGWVSMVAKQFGPNGPHSDLTSTIAFYQLVNEAEIDISPTNSATCGPNAAQSLLSFGDDMARTVKAAYANSDMPAPLVSLGTMGIGQCGVSSSVPDPVGHPNESDFAVIHSSPSIDLCEVHDYDAQSISDPSYNWYDLPNNNLAQRLKECGSKPMIIGEAGLEANIQSGDITRISKLPNPPSVSDVTLYQRAQYLSNKVASDFNAGVSGYVLWDKIMAGSDSSWNVENDETLGFGSYGFRNGGVKYQDRSSCVMGVIAYSWQLGWLPPAVPSQEDCDLMVPVAGSAAHYSFVDGTTEGWSTENTWGYLEVDTQTGTAPSVHPSSDAAKHALRLTLHTGSPAQYTPAVEVESDSVALLQPGDTVSMWVYRPVTTTADVGFSVMLRLGNDWNPCVGPTERVTAGSWEQISMSVPTNLSSASCLNTKVFNASSLDVHAVGLWIQDDSPWGGGDGKYVLVDDVTW